MKRLLSSSVSYGAALGPIMACTIVLQCMGCSTNGGSGSNGSGPAPLAAPCADAAHCPKLLEYGWDARGPGFVNGHIAEMEHLPFDGIIMLLTPGSLAFDTQAWTESSLEQPIQDVAGTAWDHFTDNFLILYSAFDDGNPDRAPMEWQNDAHWQTIQANIALFSRALADSGSAGMVFDPEPYGRNPWRYDPASGLAFAGTAALVRQRGQQFMSALQTHVSQPKILVFQLGHYIWQAALAATEPERQAALEVHIYGLLPAFMNGLIDVANDGVQIIDGNEAAYWYDEQQDYLDGADFIRGPSRNLMAPESRASYDSIIRVGQAIYMDYVMAANDSTAGDIPHSMSPEARLRYAEHNTYWALRTTDEYAWFYSERMNWWTGDIPAGLENAVRSARYKARTGADLGFDIADDLAAPQ